MTIKHKHHCQRDFDNLLERVFSRRFYCSGLLGCFEAYWRFVWMYAVLRRIWKHILVLLFLLVNNPFFLKGEFSSLKSAQSVRQLRLRRAVGLTSSAIYWEGKCTHVIFTWVNGDQYLGLVFFNWWKNNDFFFLTALTLHLLSVKESDGFGKN